MAERSCSTVQLLPENDPCTISYQKAADCQSTAQAPTKDSTRKSRRMKFRKTNIFVRGIRWLFGKKQKKSPPSFVMLKRQSSTRSRRSSAKMIPDPNSLPIPSVHLTTPSIRRGRSHYRVHSYPGVETLATVERNSVRFSHPAVTLSATALSAPIETVIEDEVEPSHRSSMLTEDSVSTELAPSSRGDSDTSPVRPKRIWQWSSQSVDTDGLRESFNDFKDRLDGHRPRADRKSTGDSPPSLQYIPRMSTIKLPNDDKPQIKCPAKNTADLEKYRSEALSALEGSVPKLPSPDYVVAVLPRKDLPITAVQLSSDEYPSILTPGVAHGRPQMPRPHTFAAASTVKDYQPYQSPPVPSDTRQLSTTRLPANETTATALNRCTQDSAKPPKFDTLANFSARHSQHYKHVESGILDGPQMTTAKLHAPTLLPNANKVPPVIARSTFLLSPTPPLPTGKTNIERNSAEARKTTAKKTVSASTPASKVSKSLSPPSAPTKSASKPVAPIPMNANGYPTFTAHPSQRFSAEAKYQRRSLDPVEAKYVREHPKKTKKVKTTSKLAQPKEESNKMKRPVAEQDKQKLIELDSQLKKLMC